MKKILAEKLTIPAGCVGGQDQVQLERHQVTQQVDQVTTARG